MVTRKFWVWWESSCWLVFSIFPWKISHGCLEICIFTGAPTLSQNSTSFHLDCIDVIAGKRGCATFKNHAPSCLLCVPLPQMVPDRGISGLPNWPERTLRKSPRPPAPPHSNVRTNPHGLLLTLGCGGRGTSADRPLVSSWPITGQLYWIWSKSWSRDSETRPQDQLNLAIGMVQKKLVSGLFLSKRY